MQTYHKGSLSNDKSLISGGSTAGTTTKPKTLASFPTILSPHVSTLHYSLGECTHSSALLDQTYAIATGYPLSCNTEVVRYYSINSGGTWCQFSLSSRSQGSQEDTKQWGSAMMRLTQHNILPSNNEQFILRCRAQSIDVNAKLTSRHYVTITRVVTAQWHLLAIPRNCKPLQESSNPMLVSYEGCTQPVICGTAGIKEISSSHLYAAYQSLWIVNP